MLNHQSKKFYFFKNGSDGPAFMLPEITAVSPITGSSVYFRFQRSGQSGTEQGLNIICGVCEKIYEPLDL